jgi:23S rRNA (cytosine1962-C5)-methyltransferase
MDMVDRNVALNGFAPASHTGYCTDAIDFLREVPEGKYDLMIVDPPAFAKHRGVLGNALRAYQRLNAAAISKVAPGGLVFTFSCSQVVDREAFSLAVFSAAAQTGRSVRILRRLGQPADHAVNIYHPEGEYLKGLLLYVE